MNFSELEKEENVLNILHKRTGIEKSIIKTIRNAETELFEEFIEELGRD